MTYFNRTTQTKLTFDYFENVYAGKYNIEVVVVDDSSREEESLRDVIHEYSFKSPNDVITYTSSGVTYDKFKTFSIKIVLGSASSSIIPKVKDLKAIALDF